MTDTKFHHERARVLNWAITGEGRVRNEIVSLVGSNERPDSTLFRPPEQFRPDRRLLDRDIARQ